MKELHYDPAKTIRTTELAIEKARERIELLENDLENRGKFREKNEDGVYEISEAAKKDIEKLKELIEWNREFIATHEEDIKKYEKDLEEIKKGL